jgi:hypothetical protein
LLLLSFFEHYYVKLTETFLALAAAAAIFIAIYGTLCAYCEIISALKTREKMEKMCRRKRKFMFDVGPLCSTLHITSSL